MVDIHHVLKSTNNAKWHSWTFGVLFPLLFAWICVPYHRFLGLLDAAKIRLNLCSSWGAEIRDLCPLPATLGGAVWWTFLTIRVLLPYAPFLQVPNYLLGPRSRRCSFWFISAPTVDIVYLDILAELHRVLTLLRVFLAFGEVIVTLWALVVVSVWSWRQLAQQLVFSLLYTLVRGACSCILTFTTADASYSVLLLRVGYSVACCWWLRLET